MKVPLICTNCECTETIEHEGNPKALKVICECGIKMSVHYTNNYEPVSEQRACHTCAHLHDADLDKCNFCNQI